MWFRPDTTDTTQFRRAAWDIGQWLILGPMFGALGLFGFALLIGAGGEGLLNALAWGAAFGLVGGVIVTGSRWMARWKV